ncbi:hypothetical protein AKJ09_11030 [Labilithrix luteola]|uniref:Uncharacterized protein n=1 Tax=Labilithrix luteola TaxID=1391654 RepID=A0A0K1QFE4_9BACT|nr:hypothetical protein AKJ09_11030 [Labilithrix luteola]
MRRRVALSFKETREKDRRAGLRYGLHVKFPYPGVDINDLDLKLKSNFKLRTVVSSEDYGENA